MKMAVSYSMILTLSCCVIACSMPKSFEQAKPFPLGEYQYVGYDKNGSKIIEGLLSITSIESEKFQGKWQFKKIGDQEKVGPQVGQGKLIGSIIKGKLYINLNPNMSDDNVNLKGMVEGNRFHGTWSYDGYAGSMNQGTFEATRK